jgi:hypothetical protein
LFSENRLEKYGGSLVQSSWSPEEPASVVLWGQKEQLVGYLEDIKMVARRTWWLPDIPRGVD